MQRRYLKISAILTGLGFAAYWIAGMPWIDALVHSFTTLSLGGFSSHDASMGHFDSLQIELVAESPEVGMNLQDHPTAGVTYFCEEESSLKDALNDANLAMWMQGQGPLTSNIGENGGFARTREAAERFVQVDLGAAGLGVGDPVVGEDAVLAEVGDARQQLLDVGREVEARRVELVAHRSAGPAAMSRS